MPNGGLDKKILVDQSTYRYSPVHTRRGHSCPYSADGPYTLFIDHSRVSPQLVLLVGSQAVPAWGSALRNEAPYRPVTPTAQRAPSAGRSKTRPPRSSVPDPARRPFWGPGSTSTIHRGHGRQPSSRHTSRGVTLDCWRTHLQRHPGEPRQGAEHVIKGSRRQ